MYIKDSLPSSVIVSGPDKFICIKIHGCSFSNEFCLGILYNPPDNVRNVLLRFCKLYHHLYFSNFVLLGDFNVNYLDSSITGFCELNNIMSSFNLYPKLCRSQLATGLHSLTWPWYLI